MRAERTLNQWNQKAQEYLETHTQSGSTVPKRSDAQEPKRLWFSEADPQCRESGSSRLFQKGAAPGTACPDGACRRAPAWWAVRVETGLTGISPCKQNILNLLI